MNTPISKTIAIKPTLEGRLDRNGNALQTINGFLPFQWEGVLFGLESDRCTYYQWSTGTGKTVAAVGAIQGREYDLCLFVVEPNNLIEAQRKLLKHADIESIVYNGTPKQRERFILDINEKIEAGERPIVIMNAEKFRVDIALFVELVEDRDLLVIFDEMPKNLATDLATSNTTATSMSCARRSCR
jgi:hypothetical protein